MKRKSIILLFIPLIAFTLPFRAVDKPGSQKCAECHADLVEGKVTHPPVSGSCDACHVSNGNPHPKAGTPGFSLKNEVPGLCYACHKPLNTKTTVHSIVNNGKCLICHTAHNSDNASLLLDHPPGNKCMECHDDLGWDEFQSKHAPATNGMCQECHDPHQSDNEKLLLSNGQDLCLKCHSASADQMKLKSVHSPFANRCASCHSAHGSKETHLLSQPADVLCFTCHDDKKDELNYPYVHSPFKNKCSICHVSHASSFSGLLTKTTLELCTGCHDDFEEPMQVSRSVHQALRDEKSCVNCHSAHASETEKILLSDQKTLCLDCHSTPVKKGNRLIASVKQEMQRPKIHGAIEKNGCSGCHNPHFADHDNLLTASFSADFYLASPKDSVALCFNCHDAGLLTEAKTTTATSFRDGDKNLHFIHINGPKGRNCTVCHEIHGALNARLIREETLFGNWVMEMNFKASDSGGTCLSGCHAEKPYKR